MSFIDDILTSASELEPPLNFWKWAGLAAISAVVKDSVWMPRGGDYYNLYPNIYVMFHAESGLKKGPPISLAKDLVKKVNNTRVISGRSSIQGILKELGTAYTQPGGKVIAKSVAFICSSELTSSIVEDKAAATILTDLYDRHYNVGDWQSLLKMETFNLKDPTVTMLTATNEAHADDFFAKKDVQGGYFARTFIIYEVTENTVNSLVLPLENSFNKDRLIDYLKKIAMLNGPFQSIGSREKNDICHIEIKDTQDNIGYVSEAGKIYDDWYKDFRATVKSQQIKDSTGTMNRFGDSVMKVAMLFSLAESTNLIIEPKHMYLAIEHCERLIGAARQTTMGKSGKSSFATVKAAVIDELMRRPQHMITRNQLMKQFMYQFESKEWDDIIFPSLQSAGVLNMEAAGNVILYVMPPEQVAEYQKFYEGKNK